MKRLALLFATALMLYRCGQTPAFAQSCPAGQTMVRDTLYGPVAPATGLATLHFGTVTITPPSIGTAANGQAFGQLPITLNISNGAVAVCLIPTDTATPVNLYYSVTWTYTGPQGRTKPWNEIWTVPTSATPVLLSAVRNTAALPPLSVRQGPAGAGMPSSTGFSDGTYCIQISAGVVTGFVACSTAPALFDSFTGLFDSAADASFDTAVH